MKKSGEITSSCLCVCISEQEKGHGIEGVSDLKKEKVHAENGMDFYHGAAYFRCCGGEAEIIEIQRNNARI